MIPIPDKFPLGIQTFEKIREGGYFYIDKTGYVARLADEGAYYFLARPRRFGKSLFLSTAEAFFSGRRDLFAGLDADTPGRDWTPHEVIHIDLSAKEYNSDDSLRNYLEELMLAYESREDSFAPLMQLSVERRLANVIESLYRRSGRGVVILIDEYDKPLLDAHRNPARLEAFRSLLKAFYAQLKSLDKYIRFVLMSGVTRFGKTSIFSDLNNLCDISDDPDYAAVCGLTADEIRSSLAAPVASLARRNGLADADLFARMEEWYGGYRFAPDADTVFNPFSILSLLKKRRWSDFWFASGTPTLLADMLEARGYDLARLTSSPVTLSSLSTIFLTGDDPIPLFYQSGYLTLGDYDPRRDTVTLRYPNREVEQGLLEFLLPHYSRCPDNPRTFVADLADMLRDNRVDDFLIALRTLIPDIAYELVTVESRERHYHSLFYIICRLIGFDAHCEYVTINGRIDMLVKTRTHIYIFEFKLDRSADIALDQINRVGYTIPFERDGRKIVRVGVNFSSATRTIEDWSISEEDD